MTKQALLKKLETMLDDAARERVYGNIEIQLKAGQPQLLRKSSTEILNHDTEKTYDRNYR